MSRVFQFPGRPVEEQVFVIGDVHGQAVTLEKTLSRIAAEAPGTGEPRHLIFTGDIIDRGPESLRAIDLVLDAKRLASVDKVTFLPGNHELMLLDAIRKDEFEMDMWTSNGGLTVFQEIYRENPHRFSDPLELIGYLPVRFRNFISLIDSSPNALRMGDLVFVHAGLLPDCDIDDFLSLPRESKDYDHWAWIGEPFLSHQGGWDRAREITVIHGHTMHDKNRMIDPVLVHDYLDLVDSNRRLCLDAGAAERGQIALLTVVGKDYALEVIQDPPFNPVYDRGLNPEIENKPKIPASCLLSP